MLIEKHVYLRTKCWEIFTESNQGYERVFMILDDLPRFFCLVGLLVYFVGCFGIIASKRFQRRFKVRKTRRNKSKEFYQLLPTLPRGGRRMYVEHLCRRAKICFKFSLSQKIITVLLSYAVV